MIAAIANIRLMHPDMDEVAGRVVLAHDDAEPTSSTTGEVRVGAGPGRLGT